MILLLAGNRKNSELLPLAPQNQDSRGIVGDTQGAQGFSDLCTEGAAKQDLLTAGSASAVVSGRRLWKWQL